MLALSLLLLLQTPTEQAVLEAEYSRNEDVSTLLSALRSPDVRLQRLATRAFGRLERPNLGDAIVPQTGSPHVEVRREAVAALAQMGAAFDFASLLPAEKAGSVRAVIYEAVGRRTPPAPGSEALLVAGLKDEDILARTGAARGLQVWVRQNIKDARPQVATIQALREAVRQNPVSRLRQFVLLALNAAGDQDRATLDVALRDPDPQVRRLAVAGSKRFVEDPSPIVRLEALRVAGTCERAAAAVSDPSGHVALAAVDVLGAKGCDPGVLVALVDHGESWRVRSRALVSLARVAPEAARGKIASFRDDPLWQVRAYAAAAARALNDEATLATLARDRNPNVAAAALTTFDEAVRALSSDHSGLLLAAAARLQGSPELKSAAPGILGTVLRLSSGGRVTVRDERLRLIELLSEVSDLAVIEELHVLLGDRDPEVAEMVARILTEKTGRTVEPKTTRYVPEPFPAAEALRSLSGAEARVAVQGLGAFSLELLTDEAPATVSKFADLAEKGAYDGLTFHRVVPNFVLQGGSPGADEYDALTPQFMRDELGLEGNERGTLGTSTRGHDTGDGQIFVNLIDNWRLDHTYTVFARVTKGMEVVDRILEGDVIEKVEIRRR